MSNWNEEDLGFHFSSANFKLHGPQFPDLPELISSPIKEEKWKYLSTLLLGRSNQMLKVLWELHCQLCQLHGQQLCQPHSLPDQSSCPLTRFWKENTEKDLSWPLSFSLSISWGLVHILLNLSCWTCPHVLVFWCYLFFSKGFEWNGHRKFTQQTTKHPSHENTFLGPDLSTKLMSTCPNHSLIFMCKIKPIFSTPPDLCQHIPSHPIAPSTMQQLPWTEIESPYNLSSHSFISQSQAL